MSEIIDMTQPDLALKDGETRDCVIVVEEILKPSGDVRVTLEELDKQMVIPYIRWKRWSSDKVNRQNYIRPFLGQRLLLTATKETVESESTNYTITLIKDATYVA